MRLRAFVIGLFLILMGYGVFLLHEIAETNKKILSRQEEQRAFLISWSKVVETQPGTIAVTMCVSGLQDEEDPVCTMPSFGWEGPVPAAK